MGRLILSATVQVGGMKLLCVWVHNPFAPGLREEAPRQAQLLRNAPEEREALDFIEAVANLGNEEA
jgi:hypothetical protein